MPTNVIVKLLIINNSYAKNSNPLALRCKSGALLQPHNQVGKATTVVSSCNYILNYTSLRRGTLTPA